MSIYTLFILYTIIDNKSNKKGKKVRGVFINTIRKRREQLGLSQSALSRLIGLAEPNLSSLELGKLKPWPKVRRDLAKALGCQESDLFPEEVSHNAE